MRTDAKIGFAIGGVLLCVLTVYAIVVPRHKKPSNTTVSLVTSPASPDPVPSAPPQLGAPDSAGTSPTLSSLSKPPFDPAPSLPSPPPATLGANSSASLADSAPGPITSNLLQNAKNLTRSEDDKPGNLQGDVYLPTGGKPKAAHAHPTPAPDDAASVSASDRAYTIKSGQTLSKIAYEVYGNSRYWVAIQRENKGLDANHLKIGSKIHLPDISPVGPVTVSDEQTPDMGPPAMTAVETPARRASPGATNGRIYTVKSGDSLYGIAKRMLGGGKKTEALYALNKDLIGPDKAKLKLGMVLKLPESSPPPAFAQ